MPTFRAISRTVNLASPSMISFILETISLRDADFGLPDFGAFLMAPFNVYRIYRLMYTVFTVCILIDRPEQTV